MNKRSQAVIDKITEGGVPYARSRLAATEIDSWLELTFDADGKIRSRAVRQLCPCHVKRHDDRIWERIFAMAEDDDLSVRRTVLHALGDGSPRALEQRVVATLERMSDDPDPRLRRSVRKLLAHYRRTGEINIL
jgi:hypothetical protein